MAFNEHSLTFTAVAAVTCSRSGRQRGFRQEEYYWMEKLSSDSPETQFEFNISVTCGYKVHFVNKVNDEIYKTNPILISLYIFHGLWDRW